MNSNRHWEINAHKYSLAWRQPRKQLRGRVVQLTGCVFHIFSIAAVAESMHKKHSRLTEDARGEIAWTLSRHTDRQAVLATLLRNGLKVLQPGSDNIVANGPPKELLSLVEAYQERSILEQSCTRKREEVPSHGIDGNLAEEVDKREILKRDSEDSILAPDQKLVDRFEYRRDTVVRFEELKDVRRLQQIMDSRN